jgi:hypothetical protein
MATDDAEKAYVVAVKAFNEAEPRWRRRMLDPRISSADAAKETEEIQRLFDAMQKGFTALLKARS